MSWPIFIPSKGRPGCATAAHFPEALVVIEPQDYDAYRHAMPAAKLHVLPEDNQGIAYVRQHILNFERARNNAWYWMFDDDIAGFSRTNALKRLEKASAAEVLAEAEALITAQPGVGQAALEYAQYAWSNTKPVKLVGYCDVAVAINTHLTRTCRYRPEMALKEDRDFTLQVLANGAKTMRTAMLSFKAPKNGSNKGGLHEEYAKAGREEAAVDRMVAAWPQCVTKQVKPDGRIDCKINWRFFKD